MPELQDIFNLYGDECRLKHKLPAHILKTMNVIEHCRTSALGYHSQVCEKYEGNIMSYHHLTTFE